MENYRIIRELGSGNYARVFLAEHKATRKQVALKLIEKRDTVLDPAREEIANMKKLRHPNVVELHESFETEEHHVLIMEYVPSGELFDYVWEKQGLDEDEARKIFSEIVAAVKHCHERTIVHRDIKLENVLLSRAGHPKLADFGFSKEIRPNEILFKHCGSPLYASPEMILGRPYVGPECDVWSLGVALYAMLTATMPFDDRNFVIFMKKLEKGEYPEPTTVSEMARDLISRMLSPSGTSRITIAGILSHPWMRSGSTRKISMSMVNRQRKSITLCYSKSEATEITRKLAKMSTIDSTNISSVEEQGLEFDSLSSDRTQGFDPQLMLKNVSNCSSGYGSGEEEEEEEEEDLVLV